MAGIRWLDEDQSAQSPGIRWVDEGTRTPSGTFANGPLKIGADAFPDALREVLKNTDWGTRNIAGAGSAVVNAWEGLKGLVGQTDPRQVAAQKVIADEAPIGNLAGNVAMLAPTAFIPGANTVAGAGTIGAVQGALLTPGDIAERAKAAGWGAGGGAGGILAGRALAAGGRALHAAAAPMTRKGQDEIVGKLMRRVSGENADEVMQRLRDARGLVPGEMPTAAEVAESGGIAALQRAMSSADPESYAYRFTKNGEAREAALRGVAGSPAARQAAIDARESAVKALYDEAKKASVQGDQAFNALLQRPSMQAATGRAANLAAERGEPFVLEAAKKGATQYIDGAGNVVQGVPAMPRPDPRMRNLVSEIIQDGGIARSEIADIGIDAAAKTRPGLFRKEGTGKTADDLVMWMEQKGWLNARDIENANRFSPGGAHDLARNMLKDAMEGKPVFHPSQDDLAYQFGDELSRWGAQYGSLEKQVLPDVPAIYSGKALHNLKMGLDDAIGTPGIGGMQGAERGAAIDTKREFLNWLESKIPAYEGARTTYSAMSKPINQMDVGQYLLDKLEPASKEYGKLTGERANAFFQALKNADATTKRALGTRAAGGISDVLTPEQMATVTNVAKSLGRVGNATDLGRGVGSNTFQNLAMDNLAAQGGVPSAVSILANFVPGMHGLGNVISGAASKVGGMLYKNADQNMRARIADLLLDPKSAAAVMDAAGKPGTLQRLVEKAANTNDAQTIGELLRYLQAAPAVAGMSATQADWR